MDPRPLLVSSILSKVVDIINQEKEGLEEKCQLERIEKELMNILRFTKHLEHEGPNTNQLELVEEIRSFALEADDVTDNFLRWRKKGILNWLILNWFHKFDIGKELDQISVKMKKITERIENYEKPKTSIVVTVETPGPSAGVGARATTIVSSALEKLNYILTQNLIVLDREVIEKAEHVRDEDLGDIQNIVSNLNPTGELSQRAQVWLKEVEDICDFTVAVAENFIALRKRQLTVAWMVPVLSRFRQYATEWNFMKQLEYISYQFGDALYRRWIFGDGGKDMHMEDNMPTISRLVCMRVTCWDILPWKLVSELISLFRHQYYQELRQIGNRIDDPIMLVFLLYGLDVSLERTRRYLALMNAFLSDIKSAEGLNERQQVWVHQLEDVAKKGNSLADAYPKDGFPYPIRRIIFAMDICELLNEIIDISDRKTIYGIANIQGRRKESASTGTGLGPGIRVSTSEIIEHNDNSHASPDSSYHRITELEKKFRFIKGEKQLMDALFRDVEEIGKLDERSNIWVEDMRRIVRENADIFVACTSECEHNLMAKLDQILENPVPYDTMANKIDRIVDEIVEATRRRDAYGLVQLQSRAESLSMIQTLSRGTQLPSLVDKQSSIVGFDGDVEALMAELLSEKENRCIITIVGIEGIGKTELAKLIFNNEAATNHFACRIWVSESSSCTVEQLLEKIAKEVAAQTMTGQPDTWTTQHPTNALEILKTKKYLIVVDGIEKCLDTLTKAIPESRASIILFTTRNKNVVPQVSASLVYHLQLLDDESSWTLFTRNLRVDNLKPELKAFGEKIVAKCGGLPSQILKMTDLLSRKLATVEEWSSVQNELNQGQNPWSEMVNSVKNLPSYLRACLFYFEQFPAAFEIPVRRLVVPWIAEGLVHHSKDQRPPEVVAESYLTRLVELNMVQIAKRKPSGKVKTCRLPNALRELLMSKANEPRSPRVHTSTDLNAVQKNSTIRRVADRLDQNDVFYKHIHGNTARDSASLGNYYKDVISFQSFDTQEGSKPGQDISNFLNLCISSKCLLLLRVLDLEDVYKPELPESIDKLTRLRYLGLRWTYLESLPSSISKLLKLQTLDLKHTYIHTLTSSIWKMELRHLFLSETYRTKFPPKPRGAGNSLSDLQTLWGLFVDEETPVEGGLDKLVNIRKLGIACQSMSLDQGAMESQLQAVANWIVNLKYLQSLRLKSRDEAGQPWNIHLKSLKEHNNLTDIYLLGYLNYPSILSHFPSSLVELTLSHSKLKQDPMQILEALPNLQSLSLLAESYVEKTLVCNSLSFPPLHVLRIWKLEKLEEWIIEPKALRSLRQLEIRSCPGIKKLPAGLKHVKSLLELKLTNMSREIYNDKRNIPPNCQVHPPF